MSIMRPFFNKKARGVGVFLVLLIMTIISCPSMDSDSGTSSSSEKRETIPVQTGVFVDSIVEGIWYSTPSFTGRTNAKGEFSYKTGEQITFSIGLVILGTVLSKHIITPLTLGGDSNLDSIGSKAKGIARILQTLDSHTSDITKIVIPVELSSLSVENIDFTKDEDLQTLVTIAETVTSNTYRLVSETEAKNAMIDFLQGYLYVGTYSGIFTAHKLNNSNSCESGTIEFTMTQNTPEDPLEVGGIAIFSSGLRITISGLSLTKSTVAGTTSDNTKWSAILDEDGNGVGTYDGSVCDGSVAFTKN